MPIRTSKSVGLIAIALCVLFGSTLRKYFWNDYRQKASATTTAKNLGKDVRGGRDERNKSGSINDIQLEIVDELLSSPYRYYVYEDRAVVQPRIREAAWRDNRTTELLTIFKAFEDHPSLRTWNVEAADFFLVPIPIYSIPRHKFRRAMNAWISSQLFNQTKGHRHIIIALDGRYFDNYAPGPIPKDIKNMFKAQVTNIIAGKAADMWEVEKMSLDTQNHGDWNSLFHSKRPIPKSGVSLGLMPGNELPLIPASYEKFRNSKYTFFYHTRALGSARDSTKYRHAPLKNLNHTTDADILNVSTIGYDIPKHDWLERFQNSKFCLVIRGDEPNSHAMLHAVKVGCIPVVVSDYYPRYSPTLKSTLNMSDFCIFIPEQNFLTNTSGALRKLMHVPESFVQQKLHALQLAQRVAIPDHPESLFVQAFLKEAYLSLPLEQQELTKPFVKNITIGQRRRLLSASS